MAIKHNPYNWEIKKRKALKPLYKEQKRFIYNRTSQRITDNLTGKTYEGNRKICDLLNQISDKSDRIAEKYYDLLYSKK